MRPSAATPVAVGGAAVVVVVVVADEDEDKDEEAAAVDVEEEEEGGPKNVRKKLQTNGWNSLLMMAVRMVLISLII